MSSEDPYMRLPERIELTLAEADGLLEVLDVAVATARTDDERLAARDAAETITTELWPELGDLVGDDEEAQAELMTTRLMEDGFRSPEAAERLGIRGRDVYKMLVEGESDGGPGRDGLVYFDEASMERYLERHGYGVVAETSHGASNESNETEDGSGVRGDTPDAQKPSSATRPGTRRHSPRRGRSDP